MKNYFRLIIVSFAAFLSSCNNETTNLQETQKDYQNLELITSTQNAKSKMTFAKAFGQALMESDKLRALVRSEALEMFDKDYDVLFAAIKTNELEHGETVETLVQSYLDDSSTLQKIESEVPGLTIFVPRLPLNSFSAEKWDTSNEIPEVAIRLNHSNKVPVFNYDGSFRILNPGEIPSFPIVVIKENERVLHTHLLNEFTRKQIKGSSFTTKSKESFVFLSDAFNGMEDLEDLPDPDGGGNPGDGGGTGGDTTQFNKDQRLIDAFNIYQNVDGWQRDYIYYNISPTTTKGEFSYDFQEQITSFSMNGDPMNALDKISDQSGDPSVEPLMVNNSSAWTNGFFEFKLRILINAKNGLGSELITYFSANPEDLFDVKYKPLVLGIMTFESVSLKRMPLNLPIVNWDLNQYASSVKIEVEEVDLTVTSTITDSRNVKFANNFSIDPTDGILKKIGLKFGSSLETNATQTIQKAFTQGNDELGAVIINFSDNVITGQEANGDYKIREYATGFYKLTIEPVKVQ